MKQAIVIPCCGPKAGGKKVPAYKMYESEFFKKAFDLAMRSVLVDTKYDTDVYIYSAKYGLIQYDTPIDEYELVLGATGNTKRGLLAKGYKIEDVVAAKDMQRVQKMQASLILEPYDRRVYLMSAQYARHLPPAEEPLKGLGWGYKMGWLTDALKNSVVL